MAGGSQHPSTSGAVPDAALWRWVFVAAAAYYAIVLIQGAALFAIPRPPLDLTFNSMLDHLLHGRFDVDPAIVGDEGFTRAGRVYAYWGIWPALVRLPLVVVPGWQTLNVTALSCWLAVTLALGAKLWTLRRVWRARPDLPGWLVTAIALTLALSGAQTGFLRPSIFQEVCLWAGAWGALFVAAAIAGWLDGFARRWLIVMAVACAGALLTRVSVAIGLFAAFGLLLLVDAWQQRSAPRALVARYAIPLAVLAIGIALTAVINAERWGNPLTFADYRYYNFNAVFPDRLPRTERYGLFNPARIPFGLVYYLAPVWAWRAPGGDLWLAGVRDRLIDSAELPPGSFLLSDPLLLLLAAIAVAHWWRARGQSSLTGGAMALGLAASPLLMLCAISMCYRYRIDFYPLIEFAAFAGLATSGWIGARRRLVWSLVAVSVMFSHAGLLLYDLGETGPAQRLIGGGIAHYYAGRAAALPH